MRTERHSRRTASETPQAPSVASLPHTSEIRSSPHFLRPCAHSSASDSGIKLDEVRETTHADVSMQSPIMEECAMATKLILLAMCCVIIAGVGDGNVRVLVCDFVSPMPVTTPNHHQHQRVAFNRPSITIPREHSYLEEQRSAHTHIDERHGSVGHGGYHPGRGKRSHSEPPGRISTIVRITP